MKAYKKDFAYSYCLGVFPLLELLKFHPDQVLQINLNPKGETNRGLEEIKKIAKVKKLPIEYSAGMIENLTNQENIYAMATFKKYVSEVAQSENHIVLVNPSDMGNLGTIIRTMLGFNVLNLAIIKPGVDIFDPKVIRSSMGALFQINFDYFPTFDDYFSKHQDHKYYALATSGRTDLKDVNFDHPFSLVFGNESSGLPESFNRFTTVKIPHTDKIDSLSLPISVGIVLAKTAEVI